jgi:probable HAF family extracellular repeat protein
LPTKLSVYFVITILLVGRESLTANHLKTLTRADGINNRGQIVGAAATTDGHNRAFLLTPVGAPTKPDVMAGRGGRNP